MSDLYGSWLQAGFDYTDVKARLDGFHTEHYQRFKERTTSIHGLAELFLEHVEAKFPELAGKLVVSYPAVLGSVGRYINDVVHYKVWHQIKVTNRSKMISHMVKWLSFYPVISINVSKDEYKKLSFESKKMALDVNIIFISTVIKWVIHYFAPDSTTETEKKYRKIFYLLETGQYDAKNAAMVFDAIL
jgi:hypothetical protein